MGMERSLVSVPPPPSSQPPDHPFFAMYCLYHSLDRQQFLGTTLYLDFSPLCEPGTYCVFKMINMGWVLFIETPSQFLGPGALNGGGNPGLSFGGAATTAGRVLSRLTTDSGKWYHLSWQARFTISAE